MYATVPATHTQERVYRVYRFTDLPADIQSAILEKDAEGSDYDFFNEMTQDNIDCDINCNDYVQSEILPAYMTLRTRSKPHSSYRDSFATENDVRYTSDSYGRFDVEFDADVDTCRFLRAHKLAGKYRTLYNAAKDGNAVAHIIETERGGWRDIAKSEAGIDLDCYASERINNQALAVEALLQAEYETLCKKIASHFETMANYYGSEEWYRDERTEGILSDILYFIDGREVPEDIANFAR